MYDELVKRLRNGLPCYGEKCLSCSDRKHCITHYEHEAADAIEAQNIHILTLQYEMMAEAESHIAEMNRLNKHIEVISKMENTTRWIPVTERLPECDLGAEVGNIEWIICGMVHAGCFGCGGKYRDAYFRTWTDAGEGMDAKDADYWRAVTLPEPQSGGEKMNYANDPVTVLPESTLLSGTIKCGGAVTCVVSKKEDK